MAVQGLVVVRSSQQTCRFRRGRRCTSRSAVTALLTRSRVQFSRVGSTAVGADLEAEVARPTFAHARWPLRAVPTLEAPLGRGCSSPAAAAAAPLTTLAEMPGL